MFAGYNRWCNERLYDAAAKISDADRADRGAFFKSLHGTLNVSCSATASGCDASPARANCRRASTRSSNDDSEALRAAGQSEDVKIVRYIDRLSDADLLASIRYRTFVRLQTIEQPLAPELDHFFNQQTHHRGQAHALLSAILGNRAKPSFDLIFISARQGWA
jgi:uncharacterized damage-inducible protein DinB